jgi:hypothetical protein
VPLEELCDIAVVREPIAVALLTICCNSREPRVGVHKLDRER